MVWEKKSINVHEKSRRHKCDSCDKLFFLKGQRDRHVQAVHEKLQKFECEICHKHFRYASYVKEHIASVHKSERITCQFCIKEYTYISYRRHLSKCRKLYSTQHSSNKDVKKE